MSHQVRPAHLHTVLSALAFSRLPPFTVVLSSALQAPVTNYASENTLVELLQLAKVLNSSIGTTLPAWFLL